MRRNFLCQPCDHRWWQHRHPDIRMQTIGAIVMLIGVFEIALGLSMLMR